MPLEMGGQLYYDYLYMMNAAVKWQHADDDDDDAIGRTEDHQVDFTTPGIWSFNAILLNACLDKLNSLRTAFPRPVSTQRRVIWFKLVDFGMEASWN